MLIEGFVHNKKNSKDKLKDTILVVGGQYKIWQEMVRLLINLLSDGSADYGSVREH